MRDSKSRCRYTMLVCGAKCEARARLMLDALSRDAFIRDTRRSVTSNARDSRYGADVRGADALTRVARCAVVQFEA
jgi:hypothetical protein